MAELLKEQLDLVNTRLLNQERELEELQNVFNDSAADIFDFTAQ